MKKSFFYYKKKLDTYNGQYQIGEVNQNQKQFEQSQVNIENNSSEQTSVSSNSSSLFDKNELKSTDETRSLDTVGAIVLDSNGCFASAISSGGILLKLPGRVGHASFFGCGCWVEESDDSLQTLDENENETNSIAICTTGCGEYIVKTLFAKQCVDHILKNKNKVDYDLNDFFNKKFFSKLIFIALMY